MNYPCIFLLAIILTVSGCVNLPPSPVHHTMTGHRQSCCDQAPLLFTDLTQSVAGRHYALPNGQACWTIENQTERS